jgi:DNA-binding NtrC family response regulator
VNLMSTPGQGTRFEILFPSAPEAARLSQSGLAPVETGPSMRGTVLLVEDEEGLRVATGKMLRKHGLTIIEASDGWAAIELIHKREQEIDLILLDMTIPGASSTEVFAEAQRVRPQAKIILTTAYSREAAAPTFDSPQLKGFIRKPYQFAELIRLLRDALAGSSESTMGQA